MDWASGGVLVMQDRRVMDKIEEFVGAYSVACSFKRVEDNFMWAFASIYEPNLDSNKSLLWEEIAGVYTWWDLPWYIGDDFYVIRFPSERLGESRL